MLDILFYAKQLFGLLLGLVIALLQILGLPGIIVFVLSSSLVSYLYVFKFLGVEEEVIENKDVLKEHFMNGFFPFLLTWIVLYNAMNFT